MESEAVLKVNLPPSLLQCSPPAARVSSSYLIENLSDYLTLLTSGLELRSPRIR